MQIIVVFCICNVNYPFWLNVFFSVGGPVGIGGKLIVKIERGETLHSFPAEIGFGDDETQRFGA